MMARMEAKATVDGIINLNMHLKALKPDRTLDAIKGQRRIDAYRQRVASLIENLQNVPETPVECESGSGGAEATQHERLREELAVSVGQMKCIRNQYARALQELGEAVLRGDRMDEAVFANAVKSMFSATTCPKGPRHCNVVQYHGTRKQRRRQHYAYVQKLFKSDTKAAARVMLDNSNQSQPLLPKKEEVFQSWGSTFHDGEGMPADLDWDESSEKDSMRPLWNPITVEEIERPLIKPARVASDSAAGPDGISPKAWNRVNSKFKKLIFNLFMFYEKVPAAFKVSTTLFTLKVKGGSADPADLRPLTICSVIIRGFNKNLAERLVALHEFDARQYAYLPRDGVGACVY